MLIALGNLSVTQRYDRSATLSPLSRSRTGQPSPSLTWSTRLKIAKRTARGVVLLEMLTGRSPELSSLSSPSTSSSASDVSELVRWVRKGFEVENPLSEMVDPVLLQEVHAKKEVVAVYTLRPRMKTVLENLERIGA